MKRWILALILGSLSSCMYRKGGASLPGELTSQEYAQCRRATQLYKDNRFVRAVIAFQAGRACEEQETYANALNNIGRGEQAAEIRLNELLAYQNPLRTDAQEATLWLNIGRDYRSVGLYDQAWEAGQMGLSLEPEMDSLRILLAQIALDLGQLDLAEANLAGVNSNRTRYRVAQSRLLNAQGRPDLALRTIAMVPKGKRDRPGVQALRTQLLLQQGEWTVASADVSGHLYTTKSNNHTVLLARRVGYLMAIGNRHQAKESWLLLQSMAPGAPLFPLAVPVERSAPSPQD